MRVTGTLSRLPLVILIDSGSTHNFLDATIVKRAGLKISNIGKIDVVVANGEKLSSLGMCSRVQINIQDKKITTDFYVLSLGGCDAVLGAYWLRPLGPILWDFANLSMQFSLEGDSYCLNGPSSNEISVVDDSQLKKPLKKGSRGVLLQLCSIVSTPTDYSNPRVEVLLQEFQDIFKEPCGLPPPRPHESTSSAT
ncbi:uncharacterized protein LOC143869736 [Tasmannia lanceolata]|uniref:uncharacterized protein LOC143869736 n=1 Tax=Tasmannia lanceolata TaxID=3420 RepID=UPI00406467FD